MPLFSVIVPVYNAEKYLSQCVESILEQTCPDFELILVDDGSPDGSGALCDAYGTAALRLSIRPTPAPPPPGRRAWTGRKASMCASPTRTTGWRNGGSRC